MLAVVPNLLRARRESSFAHCSNCPAHGRVCAKPGSATRIGAFAPQWKFRQPARDAWQGNNPASVSSAWQEFFRAARFEARFVRDERLTRLSIRKIGPLISRSVLLRTMNLSGDRGATCKSATGF